MLLAQSPQITLLQLDFTLSFWEGKRSPLSIILYGVSGDLGLITKAAVGDGCSQTCW
jgi:hypothetical protein